MPGANVQSPLSAQGVPQSVTEVRVVVAKVDAGYRASKMSGSSVYDSKRKRSAPSTTWSLGRQIGCRTPCFRFINITERPARQFIQILRGMDATALFMGLGEVMRNGKLDIDALNAFGLPGRTAPGHHAPFVGRFAPTSKRQWHIRKRHSKQPQRTAH